MRSGRTRGFTLIEMAVTIAIAAILAALAIAGLIYGSGHAKLNNGVYSVSSFATVAQMRARSRGNFEYLAFYQYPDPGNPTKNDFGVYLIERQDALTDWTTVDPANPKATDGNTVVDTLNLSSDGGFDFYPISTTTYGATLPAPFSSISLAAGGGAGTLGPGCTFCVAAGGGTLGVIQFAPDGLASNVTGGNASGGAIAFAVAEAHEQKQPKVLAISTPGGVLRVF